MGPQLLKVVFTHFTFLIVSALFIAGFYFSAKDMSSISKSYPMGVILIVAVALLWLGTTEVMKLIKNKEEFSGDQKISEVLKEWRKPIYMVVILLGYILIISYIGFYVSTILFLSILFFLLGYRRPTFILIVLAIVGSSYLLFDIWLRVPLPSGILL